MSTTKQIQDLGAEVETERLLGSVSKYFSYCGS